MAPLKVIKAGIRWRVWNGKCIKVWQSKWAANLPNYCPTFTGSANPDMMVNELIDPMTRGWNLSLVFSSFSLEEAECIINIPLPRDDTHDRIYWGYTQLGIFTVKSSYMVARRIQNKCFTPSTFCISINNLPASSTVTEIDVWINRPPLVSEWCPPGVNVTKVNVDAAFNDHNNSAGLGMVIRNCNGSILLSAVTREMFVSSPIHAEIRAILFGFKLAIQEGYDML
ncbi:hypothetical protein REPUB_Repub02eG0117900 [Reevesia pubescens]